MTNKTVYLKDYAPYPFEIKSLNLEFDLDSNSTMVKSTLEIAKSGNSDDLFLYGDNLELTSIFLSGNKLSESDYELKDGNLTIFKVPDIFSLEITTKINPEANKTLSGLYKSSTMFCTQCEAEGFRRITFYPDRPDVMTKFTTTLKADKRKYPVLLANGNLIAKGDVDEHNHYATWEDPFKKPSYLFACVAGNLIAVEDNFVTKSNRVVKIKLFVEHENLDKTAHAMEALKKSFAWDEKVFNREYDLDIFMVVAVGDFNMGAMENKGLNIFNSKYILANPQTATDVDYLMIDAVVGHEYFHNWSGNRVTCRDWFQLSLKEGFTVFREQLFTQDVSQSSTTRINQVKLLRQAQFAEDSGPMVHPVQPDSYEEINNFYTLTIYEKGSEVIRMMYNIIGEEQFLQASDHYFAANDGKAVTINEFVASMEAVSKLDLTQFKLWYKTPGTPVVTVNQAYDKSSKKLTLEFSQDSRADTPLHIPIKYGVLDKSGKEIKADTYNLIDKSAKITLDNIADEPVVSLLRNFSSPVRLKTNQTVDDLIHLVQYDSDLFNRWDAIQKLYEDCIVELYNGASEVLSKIIAAIKIVITDHKLESALKAEMLTLPAMDRLIDIMDAVEPEKLYHAKMQLFDAIATEYQSEFAGLYEVNLIDAKYQYTPDNVAKRAIKNLSLAYLVRANKNNIKFTKEQYAKSNNMTDTMAVLAAVNSIDCSERMLWLDDFYQKWQHEPLVVNKWLNLQARSELPDTFNKVKELLKHPAFSMDNPNKIYALIGGFCGGNPVRFHQPSGDGYKFLADLILELDKKNPQVASKMVRPFTKAYKYADNLKSLIIAELKRINAAQLSANTKEIVHKTLDSLNA